MPLLIYHNKPNSCRPQKSQSFNKNHHCEINYWLTVNTKLFLNSMMTEQIVQNFTSAICTNWVQLCNGNPVIHSIAQSAVVDGFFVSRSVRGNVKLAN